MKYNPESLTGSSSNELAPKMLIAALLFIWNNIQVMAIGTLRLRFINEVAGSAVTITSVIGMLKRIE